LYAIGEVGCTSLHGANRLASNSLLECVVVAYSLANTLSNNTYKASDKIDDKVISIMKNYSNAENSESDENDNIESTPNIAELTSKLKEIMWENAAIVRSESALLNALLEIQKIEEKFNSYNSNKHVCSSLEEYELRNMLLVSKSIIESALKRKHSVGAHYRTDDKTNDNTKVSKISVEKQKTKGNIKREPKVIA
jgi:L-aspartate oxidase